MQNPYCGIANTSLDKMRKGSCEFVCSPARRSRIHAEDTTERGNPFAEFMSSIGAEDIDVTTHADDSPQTIRSEST